MTDSDKVLLETSVWISYIRGDSREVRGVVDPLLDADRVATTPPVILEIVQGTKTTREFEKVLTDFRSFFLLEAGEEVWEKSYRLSFQLRRKGWRIPMADTLIAAIAIHHEMSLLHRDRHYRQISQVSPLKERYI